MTRSQQRILLGLLLIITGVVVAIVGYLGVSGETTVAFQLPYFASAGVGALMLLGGGGVLLVLAQIERDAERFDQLEDATRQLAHEVGRLMDVLEEHSGGWSPEPVQIPSLGKTVSNGSTARVAADA